MSNDLKAQESIEEAPSVFAKCSFKVVEGHIEAVCNTKEAVHELAELLEKEVILRVKPVKVTEEVA